MYQYLGCGLDNVQLRNGYEVRKTASGLDVVSIMNIEGLHRAIALNICDSSHTLTPKEFKFLRKELDMSQRQVAMFVRVEEQTVSNWERGNTQINTSSGILLRMLVKETLSGNAELRALVDQFCAADRDLEADEQLMFEVGQEHWQRAA